MTVDKKAIKVLTLSPDEIEKLLATEFGDKITPVNKSRLAQQQKRQRYQANMKKSPIVKKEADSSC